MDSEDSVGTRVPSAIEIVGLIACVAPFVISTASVSSESVNGVVTRFEYRDWIAVAGGVVGIACGLLSALSLRQTANAKHALLRGLLVLLLLAGGVFQLLRGLGKVGVDVPAPQPMHEPMIDDPTRRRGDVAATAKASSEVIPLAQRIADQLHTGKLTEIYEGSHSRLRQKVDLAMLENIHDVMIESFGPFERASGLVAEADGEQIVVRGAAIFKQATLELVIKFLPDHGVPRMIAIDIKIPPALVIEPTDAAADQFGRRVLDSLLAGKFERTLYHRRILKQLEGIDVETRLAEVIGRFGEIKSIGEAQPRECKATRCITFPIVGSKATGKLELELAYAGRSWRVGAWNLEPE